LKGKAGQNQLRKWATNLRDAGIVTGRKKSNTKKGGRKREKAQ